MSKAPPKSRCYASAVEQSAARAVRKKKKEFVKDALNPTDTVKSGLDQVDVLYINVPASTKYNFVDFVGSFLVIGWCRKWYGDRTLWKN